MQHCEDLKDRLLHYWTKKLHFDNVEYLEWFLKVKAGPHTVQYSLFRNLGYVLDEFFMKLYKAFVEQVPRDDVFGIVLPCRLGYLRSPDRGKVYEDTVEFIVTAFNGFRPDDPFDKDTLKRLETLTEDEFQVILDESEQMGFFQHFLKKLHDHDFQALDDEGDMSDLLFQSDIDFDIPPSHPKALARVHPILLLFKIIQLMNFGAKQIYKVITEDVLMSEVVSAKVLEQAYVCLLVNVLWDGTVVMQGAKGM